MHQSSVPRRRRQTAAILLAATLLLAQVAGVGAFANSYFATVNVSQQDPDYGPYHDEIWADHFTGGGSNGQAIQAEQWNMQWSDGAIANIHAVLINFGPVFHVFAPYSQCALPISYDGYAESNMPNYSVIQKNANNGSGCNSAYNGYNNEARLYMSAFDIRSGMVLYGGVEFARDAAYQYNAPFDGQTTNDLYFNNPFERKDHLTTWCFYQSGGKGLC